MSLKLSVVLGMTLLVLLALSGVGHADRDFGNVTFVTSCDPAFAAELNSAVAVLHSFWYRPFTSGHLPSPRHYFA